MTRTNQMGGMEAQGQQAAQQQGQETGQSLVNMNAGARADRPETEDRGPRGTKPATFSDWAAI